MYLEDLTNALTLVYTIFYVPIIFLKLFLYFDATVILNYNLLN